MAWVRVAQMPSIVGNVIVVNEGKTFLYFLTASNLESAKNIQFLLIRFTIAQYHWYLMIGYIENS